MRFNRRRLLFLSGFSLFSLGVLGKIIRNQNISKPSVKLETAFNHSLAVTSTLSAPILRFISVADTGTGDRGQYAVARAMTSYHSQNPYTLVVLAGDNIYNNGEIEKVDAVFEQPYKSLLKQGVKFYACLGNHDIRTTNGEQQLQYANFNMPGRYYTFRRGIVQFFALDTNRNADWKIQLAWLEQQLTHSDAPWKIVFGHHPIYSSGFYGVNQTFINTLTPLFQKHRVQLYINGHEHNYERTQPLNGTTYLICGAGAATRPVFHSKWTACAASRLSFAAFDVYQDRLTISGIDTNTQIFDRTTILLT